MPRAAAHRGRSIGPRWFVVYPEPEFRTGPAQILLLNFAKMSLNCVKIVEHFALKRNHNNLAKFSFVRSAHEPGHIN
jgi:hypothetical protein